MATGGKLAIDPSSRALLDATEATRAPLLGQKAYAYHHMLTEAPQKSANMAEVPLGRPITMLTVRDTSVR